MTDTVAATDLTPVVDAYRALRQQKIAGVVRVAGEIIPEVNDWPPNQIQQRIRAHWVEKTVVSREEWERAKVKVREALSALNAPEEPATEPEEGNEQTPETDEMTSEEEETQPPIISEEQIELPEEEEPQQAPNNGNSKRKVVTRRGRS